MLRVSWSLRLFLYYPKNIIRYYLYATEKNFSSGFTGQNKDIIISPPIVLYTYLPILSLRSKTNVREIMEYDYRSISIWIGPYPTTSDPNGFYFFTRF